MHGGGPGILVVAIVTLLGCGNGGAASPGELGGPCYPNGTCNVGLSCVGGICSADAMPYCGDGIVDLDEQCDQGTGNGDAVCDATCHRTCGNGLVDTAVGEVCDTGIASGTEACPASCNDNESCTTDVMVGTQCTSSCMHTSITTMVGGDGCCLPGANANTDADCAAVCGNSIKEPGETCDTGITSGPGACPISCVDADVCTSDVLGNDGTCQAACTNTPITTAVNGDGCCPSGADATTDDDCPLVCNDDSAFEPNETIQTAFQTPVAGQMLSVTYASLAICPSTDIDMFEVDVTVANENIEALVTYGSGDPVKAAVTNGAGIAIANATANGSSSLRAYVPNLPIGTYYVRVEATGGENNYALVLNVTN